MLTRRKRVKYTRQNNISSSESSDCSYLSDDILSNSECQQLNANVDIAINSPSEDLALSDDSEFSASCEEEQHSESLIESQSLETNIELIFACAILFAKLAKNVSKSAMDMILKIVHVSK
jgi:pseudouridine-5'-phosphate glycosidase